jgi:hypothetical protein
MITDEFSIKGRLLNDVAHQPLRADRSGTVPIRVSRRRVLDRRTRRGADVGYGATLFG